MSWQWQFMEVAQTLLLCVIVSILIVDKGSKR